MCVDFFSAFPINICLNLFKLGSKYEFFGKSTFMYGVYGMDGGSEGDPEGNNGIIHPESMR